MCEKSHYQILGVPPFSTEEEITEAYRALSRANHPDMGGDVEVFQRMQTAAEVLRDKKKRRAYDTLCMFTMDPCTRCIGSGVVFKQKGFTNRIKQLCPSCEGVGFYPRRK